VDKVVISNVMSIGALGYYSAASLAANGLGKVAVPFQTALFPHFAKLHARHQHEDLSRLFRDSVRLLSLLTSAAAAAFVFFSHDVLWVWMQSPEAAAVGAAPLSILAAAMMLNGAMAPVFSLILATGYTQISLVMNAMGFLLLVPATIYLVGRFGLPGAAMAWFVFNVAYYLIVPAWLASRWPQMSLRGFYLQDSAPYLMTSIVIFWLFSWLSKHVGPYGRLGVAALAASCCLGVGLLASPSLRRMAFALWARRQ
jgi:O-antigen/teichoic acid export membrane protein